MKKILIAAAVLIVTGALGGDVFAAGTTTVNVSANIVGTCQFSTTPTLAFGALDQTSSSDATATGTLSFWCTKGAPYILSDAANPGVGDGSYSGTISNGTDNITYSISYNNETGNGNGKTSPINSTLNATILNTDYVDVSAGAYAGTVQFTIAP
jgi:spore coat protein U-like protein